jgi:hypothetical protein
VCVCVCVCVMFHPDKKNNQMNIRGVNRHAEKSDSPSLASPRLCCLPALSSLSFFSPSLHTRPAHASPAAWCHFPREAPASPRASGPPPRCACRAGAPTRHRQAEADTQTHRSRPGRCAPRCQTSQGGSSRPCSSSATTRPGGRLSFLPSSSPPPSASSTLTIIFLR